MSTIIITTISILATIFVSRYYFKRTIDKKLTVYLQIATPVLSGIDPSVRDDLKVDYRGIKVDEIFQLQYIIANDGRRAIRNCIEPLRLNVPKDVEVLDASILYVSPEGRDVKVLTQKQANESTNIDFTFPLLNAGDFYVAKILLNSEIDLTKLKFTITVDDLPPTIESKELPLNYISHKKRKIDVAGIALALSLILMAFVFGTGLFLYGELYDLTTKEIPSFNWEYIKANAFTSSILFLWVLFTFLYALFGVVGLMSELEGLRRKYPKFSLPSHLEKDPLRIVRKTLRGSD